MKFEMTYSNPFEICLAAPSQKFKCQLGPLKHVLFHYGTHVFRDQRTYRTYHQLTRLLKWLLTGLHQRLKQVSRNKPLDDIYTINPCLQINDSNKRLTASIYYLFDHDDWCSVSNQTSEWLMVRKKATSIFRKIMVDNHALSWINPTGSGSSQFGHQYEKV